MERPVAVRRWPANSRKIQQQQSSSSMVADEEDRGSQCGVEAGTPQDRKRVMPVMVLDSEDEEEEEQEEQEEEEGEIEDSKRPKISPVEEEEDDTIVDPDECWEAPASGTITALVEPTDWVIVSRKAMSPSSSTMTALPLPRHSGEEAIKVQPLKEADPNVCVAELSDSEDDDADGLFTAAAAAPDTASGSSDDRIKVTNALSAYEKLRICYVRDKVTGDCSQKAAAALKEKNMWVNRAKRIGPVPGVEVGDIFFFRIAMCIVGLHRQTQAGIDTIRPNENKFGELIACSLVLSGGYEDDVDSGETFTYTGQGGNAYHGDKRQYRDQELVKGNLGLANSCKYDVPVRVTRGCLDSKSPSGKIYSYDGLYRVTHFWAETGMSGFRVFKYSLERDPGQLELGSRIVKFSGKLQAKMEARKAVVCEDISGGRERVPICAVNDVDAAPGPPPPFTYITKTIFPPGFLQPSYPTGCRCVGRCGDSASCLCIGKNSNKMPYTDGALYESKTILYECGPMCRCAASCPLRLSQQGQTRKLEVFKTENRGWGVRSWEAIPFGSFICEYVGELISNEEAERRVGQDEYIFDIDCIKGSRSRGVDISSFFEEKDGGEICEVVEDGHMSIDAGSCGNVSRFINHSCDPNMFVQCVFNDHNDMAYPHVMMFAMKNIRPFEELSYDYGYEIDSVRDSDGKIKKKRCYCGARRCKKRLY
ncbi:histone-lysine N-methyltransferase, H3 lysine-9 specific SUVH4 [Selaginella moellendorffii]|nr:histone-lysine N-methyltransferase, H3 lysine-9 specific SUVH4 [Selaginella moellendorffii]|eukprot:XP_002976443.2 histone-lysine N-methyltransferase, H3 lysine-9 specific SUVH4 [Selaginella moellendorffii]